MESRLKALAVLLCYVAAVALAVTAFCHVFQCESLLVPEKELILSLDQYHDLNIENVGDKLLGRIQKQPFNLVATLIFTCAIIHTFIAHYFIALSKKLKARNIAENKYPIDSFSVEMLRFMGEVEVIFGLWVIPLFAALTYVFGSTVAIHYLDDLNYLEAMFVVVIMALTSTGPIIAIAESCLKLVAKLGGETTSAWWLAILTIGPISGSLITEPGAMTISAFLLGKQFYKLKPRSKFAYATLGLLFTNISVGGVLTNFAAPPVLMVSKVWGWDTFYMFNNFGWKALVGILISNTVYYIFFRKDFRELNEKRRMQKSNLEKEDKEKQDTPLWVTLVHLFFLVWIVIHNHYPAIFIGSFLLFLGFYKATSIYQKKMELKPAVLVGFFLAGLVIHGNLQGWWIEPLLENASTEMLLVMSTFLTSFNDNAEITFLASLIPSFSETMKYAVVAGSVTGGGLTVIANAPNPSGQAILGKYFENGIAAGWLFLGAFIPTMLMGLTFYLFRNVAA